VKDLARLSLRDPEYLAVHAEAAQPTPLRLQQAYMECGAHEKLDMLWSFIKTHLRVRPESLRPVRHYSTHRAGLTLGPWRLAADFMVALSAAARCQPECQIVSCYFFCCVCCA